MNEPEIELRFPDSESRAHKLDQEIEKRIPHLPQMPVPFSHFPTLRNFSPSHSTAISLLVTVISFN